MRLIEGASEDTAELERERSLEKAVSSGTLRPVSSACGHGVVQMVLVWVQA